MKTSAFTNILLLLFLAPAASIAQQPGDLDTTFGVAGRVMSDFGGANDEGQDVALQPDGKIIVVGSASDADSGLAAFAVARYLPEGGLDASFGDDGRVTTSFGDVHAVARAITLQPDGKIVVAGYTVADGGTFAVTRYLPDGALDTTFGAGGRLTTDVGGGQVEAVLLEPEGKIVAAGGRFVTRYLPDGALDTTFGDDGLATVDFDQLAAALQSDGKIVTAGLSFNSSSSQFEFALARYLPEGALDTTFDSDGRVNTDIGGGGFALSVALQPDGRIVTSGHVFNLASGHLDFALARHLPDGMLDSTFGGDGRVTTGFGGPSQASAVALQRDGKIVAAGHALNVFGLARYLPDGALDNTFSGDGLVTTGFGDGDPLFFSSIASALVIQPDGRLVAAGLATVTGEGGFDFALARYESGLAPAWGPPMTTEECKHNGWRTFNVPRVFKSQGDCIQFVNTGN